jgi:hypothetical protein
MDDKFKDELIDKFIALVESERGIKAALAKSINKPNSYISSVTTKRNPVNATHLKAVGIVFGPRKVCELLSIDYIEPAELSKIKRNGAEEDSIVKTKSSSGAHFCGLDYFEDHDAAKEINQDLVFIERQSREAFEKARNIIKGIKEGVSVKNVGDRQKKPIAWHGEDRRKKTGS